MINEVKAGFVSIISLLLAIIISSILRIDYNHFRDAFSDLGKLHSPFYIFFNIFAFIIPGSLIFYSLRNIDLYLDIDDVSYLRIASIGWIITGLFPLSNSISWLYWMHIFGAVMSFVFAPLGIIKISSQLSGKVEWTYFSFSSTLIAFIAWASILLFGIYLHAAIAQLITIGILFVWYFVFILNLNNQIGVIEVFDSPN